MTLSTRLKEQLCASAKKFAANGDIPITARQSAVIFCNLADSFCPESYESIKRNEDWTARTEKAHSQVSGAFEMQSSNSSDALLMNIFCHPRIGTWKGVQKLFGFVPRMPVYGVMARVPKAGTNGDDTEIDLAIGDSFAEAKLTEESFTAKAKSEVEKYEMFSDIFHVSSLPQDEDNYNNYQVVRNILAAVHHDKDHLLLCDQRRPDLVRDYLRTVACVRDVRIRQRCRVIFWQEIAQCVGKSLQEFLELKYGIC